MQLTDYSGVQRFNAPALQPLVSCLLLTRAGEDPALPPPQVLLDLIKWKEIRILGKHGVELPLDVFRKLGRVFAITQPDPDEMSRIRDVLGKAAARMLKVKIIDAK